VTAPLLALLLAGGLLSPRGAVATAHPLASRAGAEALAAGGNAVDAAVAAAFALSVVENQSSGIGGGGFAVVWLAKGRRLLVLDFREVAPAAATRDMFLADGRADPRRSQEGGLAVGVPGAVKGYAELARRFGRLPLSRLVEPAARLAERGFALGRHQASHAASALASLRADPAASAEFLAPGPDGLPAPRRPGTWLRRPDLARTLRLLGRDPEAFYRGPLAARIAAAVRHRGGILTEADLAAYRTRERLPLRGRYAGHEVVTVPPPSAGGTILLGLLQAMDGQAAGGFHDPADLHAFVEVEKRLFARRAGALGDPDQVPGADAAARALADPAFARALRAEVGPRATPADELSTALPTREGSDTSQVSVIDGEGNAVAMTTTVNTPYGSGVLVPGTGILLNSQMDDFEAAPGAPNAYGLVGTGVNAVAPGRRPLSSMAPALVFDAEGRVVLAVGSPGGSTIPSTVAQVVMAVLGDGMPLEEALGRPRIHHQWRPDEVLVEPFALEAATEAALLARGHRLRHRERPFGNPQAALADWAAGLVEAASDPRFEGAPAVP
jgi:gamma-glutamyltranspeptidase/glutathione hydrolase